MTGLYATVFIFALAARPSQACVPEFRQWLFPCKDSDLLESPPGRFAEEIARIKMRQHNKLPRFVPGLARKARDADIQELARVLASTSVANKKALLRDYTRVRGAIYAYVSSNRARDRAARAGSARGPTDRVSDKLPRKRDIPAKIPAEFAEYLAGVIAFFRGDHEEAGRRWRAILALPRQRARHRATWAAFMLGRISDPAQAVRYYKQVRRLARAGYADSLGLAAASFGQQARIELYLGRSARAIELYLLQYATGDPGALSSLKFVARAVFRAGPVALGRVAAAPLARQVLVAYVLAAGGRFHSTPPPKQVGQWLAALDAQARTDPSHKLAQTDRIAWAAYQSGDMKHARRWLKHAPTTPVALWLRAKLHLRAGRVRAAAAALAQAIRRLRVSRPGACYAWEDSAGRYQCSVRPLDRAQGELAVLNLGQRQYVRALDLLLRSGWHRAASYVAESVLTHAELKRYVDRRWPASMARYDKRGGIERSAVSMRTRFLAQVAAEIRYLLARRLARQQRWDLAGPYYPPKYRARFNELVALLRTGGRSTGPKPSRASALVKAARIIRWEGLELFGTEHAPDWAQYDGNYSDGDTPTRADKSSRCKLAPVSRDEQTRVRRHVARPLKRFHYRYVAADVMLRATRLMPARDVQTARALCEANRWLRNRDPRAASRFYKELIRRCKRGDCPPPRPRAKTY